MSIEHTTVPTNGIDLHVAQDGPAGGPPVILLHGFPEYWGGWAKQIPALAAAGYRVWAPDQRGYNLSSKPAGVRAYDIDELARDVLGLIDATGHRQVRLVGHDWGAAVAWWVAGKYPDRLHKLAILNVPHLAVMFRTVWRSWAQMRRSWYIFFFQIPRLPEASLRRNGWTNAIRSLKGSARRGTFTAQDIEQYRAAWSQPGAITGMVHWYRAAARSQRKLARLGRIAVPTLMIWGAHDIALGREMAQPSIDLCDHGRLVFIEEAGHFVQHEEPGRVNELLLEFFAGLTTHHESPDPIPAEALTPFPSPRGRGAPSPPAPLPVGEENPHPRPLSLWERGGGSIRESHGIIPTVQPARESDAAATRRPS